MVDTKNGSFKTITKASPLVSASRDCNRHVLNCNLYKDLTVETFSFPYFSSEIDANKLQNENNSVLIKLLGLED
jgi:hypothetical protein